MKQSLEDRAANNLVRIGLQGSHELSRQLVSVHYNLPVTRENMSLILKGLPYWVKSIRAPGDSGFGDGRAANLPRFPL